MLMPTLFPHQELCVRMFREATAVRKRKRVIVLIPTGGGKTITANHIQDLVAKKAPNQQCIFITDRRHLVLQGYRAATKAGIKSSVIMRDHEPDWSAQIFFASKQTLESWFIRRGKVNRMTGMVLCTHDECHVSHESMIRLIKKMWPSDHPCGHKPILMGLTATAAKGNGEGLGGPNGYEEIIEPTSYQELLELERLVPSKCFAPYRPDLKHKKADLDINGDYNATFLDSLLNRKNLIGDVVKNWQQYAEGRPTFLFPCTVNHSIALVGQFKAAGIAAAHIDADTPQEERDRLLGYDDGDTRVPGELELGRVKVVSSVGVLHTGTDCPFVGCIVLCRPTKSIVLYKQMVGRGLRVYVYPDGTVKRDCVVIDHSLCTQVHGLPEWDLPWSLETGKDKKIQEKLKKAVEEGKVPSTICCKNCTCVFTAKHGKCPECGWMPTKQGGPNEIGRQAGKLVRLTADKVGAAPLDPIQQKKAMRTEWRRAIYIAVNKGYKVKVANKIFFTKFGVYPDKAGMVPHFGYADSERPMAECWAEWRERQESHIRVAEGVT